MADTYEYALVRVVPDRRRGEWVNVGVCVFLADRLDIHLHGNTSKLRAMAPNLDLGFLQDLPSFWERMTEGTQGTEARHALLSRLPLAQASAVGTFVVDAGNYAAEIDSILHDLVVPPPLAVKRMREPRLITALKKNFIHSNLYSQDAEGIHAHKVVSNFPIEAGAGLYADFAMKNGVLRITETIDFRVAADTIRSAKHGQAAIKAVTLNKAAQIHNGCVPSVVYAGSPDKQELMQPSLNLLANYAERLYDANNANDMAAYMEMVQKAATLN